MLRSGFDVAEFAYLIQEACQRLEGRDAERLSLPCYCSMAIAGRRAMLNGNIANLATISMPPAIDSL
jgi:hypothetical protein